MKKIVTILMVVALAFGVAIGACPDEYSFFNNQPVKSENSIYSLDIGSFETATTSTLKPGQYNARVKLLGFIPIKTARVNVLENKKLVPLGIPFGVKLYTDGVIVVDITDFVCNGKVSNPAFDAGIREGDIILSYNGVKIKSNEQLMAQVNKYDGNAQEVLVRRNNLEFTVNITPLRSDADSNYRIGLWVRDSTAGIGMLTFYDETKGTLAGLGHSVSDSDTGLIMPVATGELVFANIKGVIKGKSGAPGELVGSFIEEETIGILTENTGSGLDAICVTDKFKDMKAFPIALKKEIKKGKAYILSCVDGTTPQKYKVEIEKVNNNLSETKNMIIKITDKDLLSKTGGIVRGMSGSPIIQDGKLIGAVTHVLVDDPTRGYGIFIENMLETV